MPFNLGPSRLRSTHVTCIQIRPRSHGHSFGSAMQEDVQIQEHQIIDYDSRVLHPALLWQSPAGLLPEQAPSASEKFQEYLMMA